MKANLSSNKELENYKEQDTFNFITKADAIKSFLEFSLDSLNDNKMIVLYGDWGSGKSSLMKHIEKDINKTIYFPIFFKAWEHEKDDNLPLSLCAALINELKIKSKITRDFMKIASSTLKALASGFTIKSNLPLVNIEYSVEKLIKVGEESIKHIEPETYHKSLTDFKKSFTKIENLILKQDGALKLLIFIDDLDRCEPENVLNLITAIKLFFTYGEQSVFFCALDKNAVTKAVKIKYDDVVKSEEYMEKVFDISFNMPKTYDIRGILLPHFKNFNKNFKYKDWNGVDQIKTIHSIGLIEEFFKAIQFTNPRGLKKVLNKYEIIKAYRNNTNIPNEFLTLIPDVIFANSEGKFFETIFCLYIIVLFEYHLDEFQSIENYELKIVKYLKMYEQEKQASSSDFKNRIYIPNHKYQTFNGIKELGGEQCYNKFIFLFSNGNPTTINFMVSHELNKFDIFFPDNSLSSRFCRFLIKYIQEIDVEIGNSDYVLWYLFDLANYLL